MHFTNSDFIVAFRGETPELRKANENWCTTYISRNRTRDENLQILKTIRKLRLKANVSAEIRNGFEKIKQKSEKEFDLLHPAKPGNLRGWVPKGPYFRRENDPVNQNSSSYGGFVDGRLFEAGGLYLIESSANEKWSVIEDYPQFKGATMSTVGKEDWEKKGFHKTKTFIEVPYDNGNLKMKVYKFTRDVND